MLAIELVRGVLLALSIVGIYIGISWAIIEKEFDSKSLLILSCIALLVMFNI